MLNERHCVFFKNNGKKVKCKLDNSLRNFCGKQCPHYRPNIWMRIHRMLRHSKRKIRIIRVPTNAIGMIKRN